MARVISPCRALTPLRYPERRIESAVMLKPSPLASCWPRRQELVPRQPELRPEEAEIAIDQVRWKDVMPGRDRGVRGEDRGGDDPFGRLVEASDPVATHSRTRSRR